MAIIKKGYTMLSNVRLAFPTLDKAKQFTPGEGKPRFSATLLIDKADTANLDKIEAAMLEVAIEKWGPAKGKAAVEALRKTNKLAVCDGDTKAEYAGFADHMYVAAHSQANNPPTLLDGQKNLLPRDTGMLYAGCYINAAITLWAQDHATYGKRINASLGGVQFRANGDAFSAGAPASDDEFEVVEGAEATDEDFDVA